MARKDENHDVQSPAVLTGHTNEPAEVVDPVSGKIQAVHTTEVVIVDPADPDAHPLAVQGHDDPRVSGVHADPLRREPSPNEIADGASIPSFAADSHVQVGEADEDSHAAGVTSEPNENVEPDEND